MKVATGKVVGGKVIVEGDPLHESSAVTVLVPDNDETFAVSAEQEVELLGAISEADRGDFISSEQLLESLRPNGTGTQLGHRRSRSARAGHLEALFPG